MNDLILSPQFLLFLSFIAYLIALLVVVVSLLRLAGSERPPPSPIASTPHPSSVPQPASYKYVLNLNDLSKAQKIIEKLNQKNIKSALNVNGSDIKVSFNTSTKLRNVDELKKKGVIVDYEFETKPVTEEGTEFSLEFD